MGSTTGTSSRSAAGAYGATAPSTNRASAFRLPEVRCTSERSSTWRIPSSIVNLKVDDGDEFRELVVAKVLNVLKFAFDMKLCSCKQWFAGNGSMLCASCLAASAVGAAAACIVCHEPAAKRTRCCKQAMHLACHVHHTEHAPPG